MSVKGRRSLKSGQEEGQGEEGQEEGQGGGGAFTTTTSPSTCHFVVNASLCFSLRIRPFASLSASPCDSAFKIRTDPLDLSAIVIPCASLRIPDAWQLSYDGASTTSIPSSRGCSSSMLDRCRIHDAWPWESVLSLFTR